MYGIHFEFDVEGDPPQVFIAEDEGRGIDILEVLEEPACKKPWSWDDQDWEVGDLAKRILNWLNT